MRKSIKIVSFILAVIISLSGTIMAFAKEEVKTEEEIIAECEKKTNFLSTLVDDIVIGTIAKLAPRTSVVRNDSDPLGEDNFFGGDSSFISTTEAGDIWKLGYGSASIIPDDFGVGLKYARGSYVPWFYSTDFYTDDDGNKEDMKVRTILIDDQTGRGLVLIASVDCIGISNTDVRKIRAGLEDFAKTNNVKSLNISAIHSHMAIDSQGVWGHPFLTIINNILSIFHITEAKSGVEKDYLNKIISATKSSAEDALKDMTAGKLTYTEIEAPGYMGTRTDSPECDDSIHRIMFYPTDKSKKGTVLASFGAHPEMTSYGHELDSRLSADYVYYMEKLVNKSGNNFIYVQGNVGTNGCWTGYSDDGLPLERHEQAMRYGYEMAYLTLGASMTENQRIELNNSLGDMLGINKYGNNEGYTKWYSNLPTFTEKPIKAVLNVKHKQVKLEINNSTSLALLKLGIASNDISYNRSERKYYTTTEIGYMEFGDTLKVFLSPGELYSELYVGGYGLRKSEYKSLRESYGENVILFDLMNDAAGYVCPDETYAVIGYKYKPADGTIVNDTWCVAVSIGDKTASTLMKEYSNLVHSTEK